MTGRLLRFCAIPLIFFAGHAWGAEIEHYQIGNWYVGAYSDDQTGAFSHCSMAASYVSGITMLFGMSGDFRWDIGFADPQWNLTEGSKYNLIYTIDSSLPKSAQALAVNEHEVTILLAGSESLFDRFQHGYRMKIAAAGQTFYFNLTGTARALSAVRQCAERHAVIAQQPHSSNPFISSPKTPQPALLARAEATALIANILSQAGISGFHILEPSEVPPSFAGYDAVWTAGTIMGTVTVVPPSSDLKIEDIPSILISADARSCKGKFVSGSIPDTKSSEMKAVHLFTACETAEKDWTDYYNALPRSAGGDYVFSVGGLLGKDQTADHDIEQADESVRRAAYKILEH